jgi:pSer/pThr/pTyr-binding forkhead associated (FHA) protein
LDDGREDGEWFRLREDEYVIGRTDGEIRIPNDTMISGRHAKLERRAENNGYRWYLTDLESTNGTYVRIGDAILKHNQELLIGARRYRFETPVLAEAARREAEGPARGTRGWQEIGRNDARPFLVELTTKGEGERYTLQKEENWVGRNATQCNVVLKNDPLVSPRHARISLDSKGRWRVHNGKTLNGTWLRIDSMALETACQFQLGEQRFILKVL